MTKDEYKAKIAEIDKQEAELRSQRRKVHKEFRDSVFKELEVKGITPGTKVLVKAKSWNDNEVEIEAYLFDVGTVYGDVTYIFHKVKKDGTMSQINQYIGGRVISIHKI